MTTLQTSIRVETPLALSVRRGAGNDYDTLSYIPGTVLRGALAKSYLDAGGDASDPAFQELFLSAGVRYLDHRLDSSFPWPASTFECAADPHQHPRVDLLLRGASGGSLLDECRQCGAKLRRATGFALPGSRTDSHPYMARTVRRSRRAHSQIDPATLRVEAGNFHTSITLDPQQSFLGGIVSTVGAAESVRSILSTAGDTLWLGRGRSRGQGRVSFTRTSSPPPSPLLERILDLNRKARKLYMGFANHLLFSCTFLSPAILYDTWLFSTNQLQSKDISPDLHSFSCPFQFSALVSIPGWHAAAGLPRPATGAVAAGSSYLFSRLCDPQEWEAEASSLAAILAPIELSGVGERLNEGFGEAVFCHPIHAELAR